MAPAKDITQLDVFSHGFPGGMIGNGQNSGIYTLVFRNYVSNMASTPIESLADALVRKLAAGAKIRFFGCNTVFIARALSKALKDRGVKGINIIGASGLTSPLPGKRENQGRTASRGELPDLEGHHRDNVPRAPQATGYHESYIDGRATGVKQRILLFNEK